ncbi:MAG: GNAT family N-acetyltransferase [Candidatus Bathyarchaeota archaeon]|nr:GNAT family N-acetyltransferase [Candidatus Bathyarchaeota archaeon]
MKQFSVRKLFCSPFVTVQNPTGNKQSLRTDAEKCVLRTYREGDEEELARLFNQTHTHLAGFAPRTPAYWRWCCLTRPDVEKEGIFVAAVQNEVVGYAVVGKTGNIWEMSYCTNCDGKAVFRKLLTQAAEYARNVGSDSLVLNEYAENQVVREVCQELDFVETPAEQCFLSVMDLPRLLSEVLQSRKEAIDFEGTFMFQVTKCPDWFKNQFVLKTEKKGFSLINGAVNPEVTVTIDLQTFVSVLFGAGSVRKAVLSSRIQVRPFWKLQKTVRLLSLMQVKSMWAIPRADIG